MRVTRGARRTTIRVGNALRVKGLLPLSSSFVVSERVPGWPFPETQTCTGRLDETGANRNLAESERVLTHGNTATKSSVFRRSPSGSVFGTHP